MSLFNPYVILGIVLAVLSAFGSGYWKGSEDEITRQQLEIAKLNAEARQKEQILVSAIQTQATKLQKANQDAKLVQQKRNADIDSGALRLRIPVKATYCPVQTTTDTASATGSGAGEARANIDPEVGKNLFAIAEEGDRAIQKLNACIDLYNKAVESQKEIK